MKNVDKQKIGILLVILSAIVLIGTWIMYLMPSEYKEVVEKNNTLSEEETIYLLKSMQKYLSSSEGLSEKKFTNEEMIAFSISYMEVVETYSQDLTYNEDNSIAIVNTKYLSEVMEYIFGVTSIDFDNIEYEMIGQDIYVPRNIQGGDAQVYKYNNTKYDEINDIYIAQIDCLEMVGQINSEVLDVTENEYTDDDVIAKLLVKYKVIENRKVLLAYSVII